MKTYDHPNDALDYLPSRPLVTYAKDQVIYSGTSDSLYEVAAGRVKVLGIPAGAREAIIKIVSLEGLFGESCLIGGTTVERAVALDEVRLAAWEREEVEQLIEKEPLLGMALIEDLVVTSLDMQDRVQLMASYKTPERVMFTLLQLAQALGEEMADGVIHMGPLTHQLIAQHAGTSREIVSAAMGRLRQLGLLNYTRKDIQIHGRAMENALYSKGVKLMHRGLLSGCPQELAKAKLVTQHGR
jgi:CRP/FNR family transcriptional regulator, cyclic AMP receptor protein